MQPRAIRRFVMAVGRELVRLSPVTPGVRDWFRADGYMECGVCGCLYMEHPDGEFPTLHVLCDGQRVKC